VFCIARGLQKAFLMFLVIKNTAHLPDGAQAACNELGHMPTQEEKGQTRGGAGDELEPTSDPPDAFKREHLLRLVMVVVMKIAMIVVMVFV
jgi:hypothetical protein